MASQEELDAAIKAKGDEIRALKTAKAEKDAVLAEVAKLNVRTHGRSLWAMVFQGVCACVGPVLPVMECESSSRFIRHIYWRILTTAPISMPHTHDVAIEILRSTLCL
jgi:hypothetical protein